VTGIGEIEDMEGIGTMTEGIRARHGSSSAG